jgi:hypothetical protein
MPEILLGSINRENLPKSVRKRATLAAARKKKRPPKKLFQKVGAVSLV